MITTTEKNIICRRRIALLLSTEGFRIFFLIHLETSPISEKQYAVHLFLCQLVSPQNRLELEGVSLQIFLQLAFEKRTLDRLVG